MFDALFHLKILQQSKFAALYTFAECCQLKDVHRDKLKCACDAVKMQNEKNSSKNELFQNLEPNFNIIVNTLLEHFQAFSCGKSALFPRV